MPWRLIQFIFIFAVILLFVVFNLTNKSDISFGLKSIKDVPVYLTVFTSFILGMICTLPFMFRAESQKKNKTEKPEKKQAQSGLSNKSGRDSGKSSGENEFTDRSSYGID